MTDDAIVLEHMARVGFERMFEERWLALHPRALDRTMWHEVAKAMLKEARRWHALPKKAT